jgi:hypothetical protein
MIGQAWFSIVQSRLERMPGSNLLILAPISFGTLRPARRSVSKPAEKTGIDHRRKF